MGSGVYICLHNHSGKLNWSGVECGRHLVSKLKKQSSRCEVGLFCTFGGGDGDGGWESGNQLTSSCEHEHLETVGFEIVVRDPTWGRDSL